MIVLLQITVNDKLSLCKFLVVRVLIIFFSNFTECAAFYLEWNEIQYFIPLLSTIQIKIKIIKQYLEQWVAFLPSRDFTTINSITS